MRGQSGARRMSKVVRTIFWIAVALIVCAFPKKAHAQLSSFNDSLGEHAIFLGSDAHVHQLLCSSNCGAGSSWINQDLTGMAGGTAVGQFSSVASYSDPLGEHVFLVDSTQHINHLFSPTNGISWTNTGLGPQSAGGAVSISGYSALGEFNYSTTNLERLFYETTDQHVHMLVSSNNGPFGDADLTAATGGTLAASGTGFASFHDDSGEHVFYVGANMHVYQLYGAWASRQGIMCNLVTHLCQVVTYGYVTWTNQDLTAQTIAPLTCTEFSSLCSGGNPTTGFSDATGEYVFYETQDGHMHKLQNAGSRWTDMDLSNATGVLPAFASPASFSNPVGEQLFVVGTDMDVHQIVDHFPGLLPPAPWTTANPTTATGAPMASPCFGVQVAGFSRFIDTQAVEADVFYAATDGSIHRLSQIGSVVSLGFLVVWSPGPWANTNLTPSSTEVAPMFRCWN